MRGVAPQHQKQSVLDPVQGPNPANLSRYPSLCSYTKTKGVPCKLHCTYIVSHNQDSASARTVSEHS